MTASKHNSSSLTVSPPREAVQEEVVYYSFLLSAHLTLQFFNHYADSRLADIEEDCKCSILVNSRRRRLPRQKHHSSAAVAKATAATANGTAAELDSTVEVLLDETGGNFGRSVSRLSALVRAYGGELQIRRLIKKLSLADGSKKYYVEQPRRRLKEVLSPDSGTLDGSVTTAAEVASTATHGSSSVVMSFTEEADGHWSLYSLVSPFMDLAHPQQSRELARTLWIPAARLLADCTRSLVTEVTAGELISFSSYSKSGFDASLGDIVSTDCDSPADDTTDTTTEGEECKNYSHKPEPELVLLVTALLSQRHQVPPSGCDDLIENFISTASNSLNFTREHQADCLVPSFTEPLPPTKLTESRLGLHGAEVKQRACAAVSAYGTNYAAPKLTRAHQTHTCCHLSQAAYTCLPYRLSQDCGNLGKSLAYSGPPRGACQHTERLSQAAGSTSQLSHLCETGALPACQVMLSSGLVNSYPTGPASQLGKLGHFNSGGSSLRLPSSFQAVGHPGGHATLRAATAYCEQAMPAAALKSTLTGESANNERISIPLNVSLRPKNSSAKCVRQPLVAASVTGYSTKSHVRAKAAESVLAGWAQDSATAHVTVYQDGASSHHQTVDLPRLLAADVAVTPSLRDERSEAAGFEVNSDSHYELCSFATHNAALEKRKHSAGGAEGSSEMARAPRLQCTASSLHQACCSEHNCAHLRVVQDESSARFEGGLPARAGSEGLCQLAAQTAVKGFACRVCPVSAAALTPLLSSSNETADLYNTTSAKVGLLRSNSQCHPVALNALSPIHCCDSLLPAWASTDGVRGISCEYKQIPSTSASATYSLTFSQVTEPIKCSALGTRRHCAGLKLAPDAAIFPQVCHEPHPECAVRCAEVASGHQTAETDRQVGALSLPIIELHSIGKESCAVCVPNADCALLLREELKSSPRTGLNEVMETSIFLAAASNCESACTGLVNGPAWCHHAQEAVCYVRVFERQSGQLISGQCWHQLVDAVSDTVGALEWAVAWPDGWQSAAVLMEQTASMQAASAHKSRQKDSGTLSVPEGNVKQCSELVWESRRRIQLMQSILN